MSLSESCSSVAREEGKPSRARWLYPVALATGIVTASGRGQVAGPEIVNLDKLVHFAVFGLLATLVARAPGMRRGWMPVAAVALFGASDEIRQGFTPGRSMEFADWVADASGAAAAVALYTGWGWYRRLLEAPLGRKRRGAVVVSIAVSAATDSSSSVTVSVV